MPGPEEIISDDEVVYRLIQPGSDWFEPPDVIKSSNFKLKKKKDELGISIFRAVMISPAEVRDILDADDSYPVASAGAGDIRNAKNAAGDDLHLDIIPINKPPHHPSHAEIRGNITKSASRSLTKIFQIIDPMP